MAKGNSNGPTVHVKATRSKTANQQAKAKRNIELAQKRLAELQNAQRLGFKSVEDYKASIENAAASDWLSRVFKVRGYGGTIQRWLASRINLPAVQVKALVVEFLSRSNNVDIAAVVADEAFEGFKEQLAA